jgi:predicted nucleic acid-binding protein
VNVVFDTNILVDALNDVPNGVDELSSQKDAGISVVTWIEVLAGCRTDAEGAIVRRLMRTFDMVEVPPTVAERAVQIRRSRRLRLPDAIILATALEHGCVLVTRNTKDFSESDPAVRVPYRL